MDELDLLAELAKRGAEVRELRAVAERAIHVAEQWREVALEHRRADQKCSP